MPLNEEGFIDRVSLRHSVSPDAVRTILRALRSGGGTMAQFSHAEFGGMSQWSPGMTMVGDMFNNKLKAKLDAVCTELATYVAETPSPERGRWRGDGEVSYRGTKQGSNWWPSNLGTPSAVGGPKMTFGMLCFPVASQSMTVGTSRFTILAIIKSSAWPKRKAQTRL
jgi:hypothetical protein